MRISDWSSDVCSSDLRLVDEDQAHRQQCGDGAHDDAGDHDAEGRLVVEEGAEARHVVGGQHGEGHTEGGDGSTGLAGEPAPAAGTDRDGLLAHRKPTSAGRLGGPSGIWPRWTRSPSLSPMSAPPRPWSVEPAPAPQED